MNILIAPNSMKGSLTSFDFAEIVDKSFINNTPGFFKTRKVPVADGGDETGEVLIRALKLNKYNVKVNNPLSRKIKAEFGYSDGTAVIEMANASGMKLLAREDLNPMKTSSFGTGQLIVKAIKTGAKKIFLGIGGSATVDGGMGMMEAMGVKFYNQNNEILIGSGSNLLHIKSIDTKNLIKFQDIEINIICDVDNPLLGINGAANVFAPQKGASPEMVVKLENGLANFENIIKTYSGIETAGIAGCGAAGGIPIGLVAFMNAVIMEGSEYVLDLLSFDKHVKWADIVITGEGKFDSQSLCNKAPFAVAKRAKKYGKPVYAIVGSNEYPGQTIFKKVLPLSNQNTSLENAIKNAAILVHQRADKLADLLKLI